MSLFVFGPPIHQFLMRKWGSRAGPKVQKGIFWVEEMNIENERKEEISR
jgi:hypothetical protein